MDNLPPNHDTKLDNPPTELHELAGLVSVGVDEEGDIEWVGTKQNWDKYEELLNQELTQ